MRLVCLSDTHGFHNRLAHPVPEGDVLIHAGDLTARDRSNEHVHFLGWLGGLPHPHKVLIAGNHDGVYERMGITMPRLCRERGVTYLEHQAATVAGLRFFGSPWTPEFYDWHFMYPRGGARARALWAEIPEGLDVLVTHGPPHGILDRTDRGDAAGCEALARRLFGGDTDALREPPRVAVCGHIHEGYGEAHVGPTRVLNASVCTAGYRPLNAPIVVDL